MEPHKLIGYILLVAGLLCIVVPLWHTFNIFTGAAMPAQVFKAPEAQVSQEGSGFDMQQQIQNAFIKILPLDLLNNTLNLASWIFLMWIFIFAGKQIADIGIKLLKVSQPQ